MKSVNRIFIVLVIIGILGFGFCDTVRAENSFNEININDNDLYNETNTYNYLLKNDEETKKHNFNYGYRYNLGEKNNNAVDDGDPLLTVITHGLGVGASCWSNDNEEIEDFAYDHDSIITSLAQKSRCNIYWWDYDNLGGASFYDITEVVYNGIESGRSMLYTSGRKINHISSISRHSVLIFEASEHAMIGGNENVYTEFNYAVSSVVYDIKKLNGNKLPRINLIGHSRGGLTNLQYALDHPDLVESIYSLGTPYLGTTIAALANELNPSFLDTPEAAHDILSSEVYLKYLNNWNNNYEKYYKNISVTAYAGYISFSSLLSILSKDDAYEFVIEDFDQKGKFAKEFIKSFSELVVGIVYSIKLLNTAESILNLNFFDETLVSYISELCRDAGWEIDDCSIDELVQMLANEIHVSKKAPFMAWHNDICVDVGSALGYKGANSAFGESYKGFKRVKKMFDNSNCNLNAVAMDFPPVPHNLEPRDEELCNYIVSDINLGNADYGFLYTPVYDSDGNETNDIVINQFYGQMEGNTLFIPEKIDDKSVVGIADFAFSNNVYGNDNIKKIQIPSTIKTIGKNAFYNSESIEEIIFDGSSSLTKIGSYAFSNIPNLKSFSISYSVKEIEENAFKNSGIENFDIKLNDRYQWYNGMLIDKKVYYQGTNVNNYKVIYASPNLENIKFPDSVKFIESGLFEGNQNIKTINLNKVKFIGSSAFRYSSLEEISGYENVELVENYAFDFTPWKNNQNTPYIKLGNTLLECKSNDDYITIDDDIKMISSESFLSNTKGIIIGANVESIGDNAFINCPKLEWILFTSLNESFIGNDVVNDNVVIYVPYNKIESYKNYVTFGSLKSRITGKKICIKVQTDNSEENYEIYYGGKITIEPAKITGSDFSYWDILGENAKIYPNEVIYYLHDLTLIPHYDAIKYNLSLEIDDDELNSEYLYNEIHIENPSKSGYEFVGWYNSDNEMIISNTGNVNYSKLKREDILFARFTAIDYRVSYVLYDGVLDNQISYFSAINPLDQSKIEPKKFGYVFDYWKYNGNRFENTRGIYEDITLVAVWKGTLLVPKTSSLTIADTYSVIDLGNTSLSQLNISINSNVQTITILGHGKMIYSFNLSVLGRSKPLIIGLSNVSLLATTSSGIGNSVIRCDSIVDIYLNVDGKVSLYGGAGANGALPTGYASQGNDVMNGMNGKKGGSAIKVHRLYVSPFSSDSSLYVYGGAGGNGSNGYNGANGKNGTKGPSGNIFKPVKGESGGNGGVGGNGGNGGQGGYAIEVGGQNNLFVSEDLNYYFCGGRGGSGGNGGQGGNGGNGASDKSSSITKGVGDPGNGGNGGDGGSGGNGGNGSKATNALHVYGYGGNYGYAGLGGQGGDKGLGGKKGTVGKNGKNGTDGTDGSDGKNGQNGYQGENLEATLAGIKNYSNMFKRDFVNFVFIN